MKKAKASPKPGLASGERFKQALALHANRLSNKVIKDTTIVARIMAALGLKPPIKTAMQISKLLGGDANAWDIALVLMSYPSFKSDGLVLQKGEVMDKETLAELGDLVFAWYEDNGWSIES
ncbi:hypothetical protein ACVI1L_004717 [Bradyrhizobium sp. USDA 4516]